MAIKGDIPEAIKFPPIKNEQEVRLQGVNETIAAHVWSFIAPKKKICETTLNYSPFYGILYRIFRPIART
jgi:hypothetical protein